MSVGDNLNRKKLHQYVDRIFDIIAILLYFTIYNFKTFFPEKKTFG